MVEDEVSVRCYGALRNYSCDGTLRIPRQIGMTAFQVKKAIVAAIKQRSANFTRDELVLNHSIVGHDDGMIGDDELISPEHLKSLCLLPPVNGG